MSCLEKKKNLRVCVCRGSRCQNVEVTKVPALRVFLVSVSKFLAKCVQDGW